MDLAPDFDEFIGSLIAHGAEFVVVGAYALAFHGAPRFTGDLDILIRPTVDNASRVLTAIRAFGFPAGDDLHPEDLANPRRMLEMGVPPVQIHVMSAITGVTWDEVWADRTVGPCGRHHVSYVGRDTFIRNKRSAGVEGEDRPDATPQRFFDGDFNAEGAHFSRDGRYVAYVSDESGTNEIYIRPSSGTGGQVTVSVGGGTEPVWAANGDLFYTSLDRNRMFRVSVTTAPTLKVGPPVELFRAPSYVSPTGSPRAQYDVTADGQRLLMLRADVDSRPRVTVALHWLEELKRLVPRD